MYSHCHLEKKESKRVLANRMTIGTSIGSRMSQHVRKPSLVLIKANIPSFLMLLHTNLKSIIKNYTLQGLFQDFTQAGANALWQISRGVKSKF